MEHIMIKESILAKQNAKLIKLIILDVDGVLTDGQIIYTSEGQEIKNFNVRDGFGIRLAHRAGIKTAIISARQSNVITQRAKELEITEIHQNALQKLPAYEQILKLHELTDKQVAYMGDDLIDLPILRRVGLAVAVADAVPEVRQAAHYVTLNPGGKGAVRELIELILKAQGCWEKVTSRYFLKQ
jgi:3-deoxy-D-manno-octulosonate 8-phosphate phosphatase (KDO 8-P phosphatase)